MVAPPRTPLRVDRLRALNAPRRMDVEVNGQGLPTMVSLKEMEGDGGRGRTKEDDDKALTPGASPGARRWQVESIGEIWRVDDEWWRQPISRRYVEVVLEGGKHTVVFEDLTSGHWFIQSI